MRRGWLSLASFAVFAACVVPIEDVETKDASAGNDAANSGGTGGGVDGSAGTTGATGGAAGTGAASNGGTAGSPSAGAGGIVDSGTGDSPLSGCKSPLQGGSCSDIATGVPDCDKCMHEVCCLQLDECLKDEKCGQSVACYLNHCFGQPATVCMLQNCQECVLGAASMFTQLSSCLLQQCGGPGSSCPEFQQ